MSKWSEGAEGFICPYCLVSFASSNKLQAHFIDFHSNEGGDAAFIQESEPSIEENDVVMDGLGHYWKAVSLIKPCSCEVCNDIIWSSSLTCQECQMIIHVDKCQEQVTKVCPDTTTNKGQQNGDLGNPRSDPPPPPKGIQEIVRRQVSKGRNRYVDDGFDLDLSYITERIIAMSFPASGVESAYRNSLKDVAKMLKTRHEENYLIFNLSERSYDITRFNNQVLDFGWPDHLAPSLERLSIVCKSMKSWLDSDPQHVVVVHCKGGKGRTGCVIAAFMHYSQICQSADIALDRFAMKRFYDDKLQGVTQPSQRRYVHYFEDLLSGRISLDAPHIKLCHVIIHGVPNFDGKGGCRPFLKIYQNMELIHTSGLYVCSSDKERIKISLYGGLKLNGEILIKCFHKRTHTGVDSIFRCQFHHAIVTDYRMVCTKQDLDDSFRDKRFPDNVKVEFIFEKLSDKPQRRNKMVPKQQSDPVDIRHSLLAERVGDSIVLSSSVGPDGKRNSYSYFEGGYDHGMPGGELPDLIQLGDHHVGKRDRSSTNDSFKMDPELIERVTSHDGDVYTVVSKITGNNGHEISPNQSEQCNGSSVLTSVGSHKYSHLVHNHGGDIPNVVEPNRKVPPPKPKRPPLPSNEKCEYSHLSTPKNKVPQTKVVPSYDDVEKDKKLVLTPVTKRDSDNDNEMWMSVRWQTLPQERRDSSLSNHRSSSQTALDNLTIMEDYSNISEIACGRAFISQRRHSFTEGDSSIIITSPTAPQTDNDDDIYTIPPDANIDDYAEIEDQNYVNFDADKYVHQYQNRDELRNEMVRESSTPEETKPATVFKKELPPTSFKDLIMKNLGIKKPETVTVIQSSSLSQNEKKQTFGIINFTGASKHGLQVGRGDYMQFNADSWGDKQRPKRPPPPAKKLPLPPEPKPHPVRNNKEDVKLRAISEGPLNIQSPGPKEKPITAMKPQHRPLKGMKSQPIVDKSDHTHNHLPHKQTSVKLPPLTFTKELPESRTKPSPPPKPAPYQVQRNKSPSPTTVSQVKVLMSLWYRPDITREEACSLVKKMNPGSFIVRDSQTVSGGYAVTIKVDKDIVRQKKKIDETIEVTDDMCVTHFLIQPDPEGVKLQGWNEPAFKTLPDFIARHTVEKLCLPCILQLPKGPTRVTGKTKSENPSQGLLLGAACDLVFLGTIEVSCPVGDIMIGDAVQQLKALDLPTITVINFKASANGITVTDNASGLLSKRNYPLHTITHCGLDPNDTRWDIPQFENSSLPLTNKPCFGIIHKMLDSPGYVCLLFAELDSHQPVSYVVSYMKRLLNQSK